jgi:hypothetical protein
LSAEFKPRPKCSSNNKGEIEVVEAEIDVEPELTPLPDGPVVPPGGVRSPAPAFSAEDDDGNPPHNLRGQVVNTTSASNCMATLFMALFLVCLISARRCPSTPAPPDPTTLMTFRTTSVTAAKAYPRITELLEEAWVSRAGSNFAPHL